MNRSYYSVVGICIIGAFANSALAASKPSIVAALSPNYSQGTYGSADTTSMISLPFSVRYKNGRFGAKLSTGYISSTTTTSTGPGNGGNKKSAIGNNSVTASGSAKYRIIDGENWKPDITPYGKIKFNAETNNFAGGNSSIEVGAEFDWMVGDQLFPFVGTGVINVADATGSRKNALLLSAGVGYSLSDKTFLSAMITRDQEVRVVSEDPLDLIFSWSYKLDTKSSVQAYFDKGLSNGSPDIGLGGSYEYKF